MSKVNKYRALKKEPKAYVHGWNGEDQTNNIWVYGSAVIPIYINTYPTERMEMVIDVNYDELDYWQPSYSTCEIISNTVGQYIGVPDKNGKEIYEGDIARIPSWITNHGDYALCKQTDLSSGTYSIVGFAFFDLKGNLVDSDEWDEYEVIGNVYENADLLKEVD